MNKIISVSNRNKVYETRIDAYLFNRSIGVKKPIKKGMRIRPKVTFGKKNLLPASSDLYEKFDLICQILENGKKMPENVEPIMDIIRNIHKASETQYFIDHYLDKLQISEEGKDFLKCKLNDQIEIIYASEYVPKCQIC